MPPEVLCPITCYNVEVDVFVPLIERCRNNSPNFHPFELVETMSDAATQQPLTFSNRVDIMQRMESILSEKEMLQTRVSVLEGQVENVR
jgi:hypothetical protein